jgi:hypothetical protein
MDAIRITLLDTQDMATMQISEKISKIVIPKDYCTSKSLLQ